MPNRAWATSARKLRRKAYLQALELMKEAALIEQPHFSTSLKYEIDDQ
jgi:hypothetical protein